MSIGVIATWNVAPGREDEVEALLVEMRRQTRAEPGCLLYELHRIPDEPAFVLYEQYVDAAAIEAHHATDHYRELVLGRAPALLRSREVRRMRVVVTPGP
jgi:quinol monooxygenase YgiN